MDRIALVTGGKTDADPVAEALERVGFAVNQAGSAGELETLGAAVRHGSLACYVQMPFEAAVGGRNPIGRAAQFLAGGIVARFEAAALSLPLLRPDACVILIDGETPPEGTPDDPGARHDLLRVLSRSLSGAFPAGDLKSVIVGNDRSAEEIAHMAVQRGEDRQWLHSRVRSIPAELSYADWRNEMLGLT